jgi:hypothetical protein
MTYISQSASGGRRNLSRAPLRFVDRVSVDKVALVAHDEEYGVVRSFLSAVAIVVIPNHF